VPYLHPEDAGVLVDTDRMAEALLDPAYQRDGISILGGEPFNQPAALLGLVRALRIRGCRHILAYSGYTYEQLRRIARVRHAVGAVLDEIDVLIDGPFLKERTGSAGPWTGSGNQRVISLAKTRAQGGLVMVAEDGDVDPRPPEERAPGPGAP
jgi:anaerobic ribonucleoside-triphosphate reductase activating protein